MGSVILRDAAAALKEGVRLGLGPPGNKSHAGESWKVWVTPFPAITTPTPFESSAM